MNIIERLYRSKIGIFMSKIAWKMNFLNTPKMIYGYQNPKNKEFHKYTRISNTASILNKDKLDIDNFVWIWHYSIIDATEGIKIHEGAQIGAWVGIFTHGSEHSIRLLGKKFVHIPNKSRRGYTRGSVSIGPYTFVGAASIILPGVKIGKGCIIGAKSLIIKDIPSYSIAIGNPTKIVGSTVDLDLKKFLDYDYSATYYDEIALAKIKYMIRNGKT